MKIGVVLPMAEDPQTEAAPPWREIRALAQQAEAIGVDSVWLYDHLLYRFPDRPTFGIWECWTLLCAVAEATERVELGTIVLCTAFRNPAVLAKMASTLDEVSGGRLILGLGAGWHQPEFDAFGLPFDHKAGHFEEALKIIVPLLKEGKVDFRGEYYSAPDCELRPRGPRPGKLPVLIASKGPRMLRLTAEYADSWNSAWFGKPTNFLPRRADLETACADVGRDPKTLETTAGVTIAFPDLIENDPPANDPDRVLIGTPEEIAAGLREYDALGVGHAICIVNPMTEAGFARFADVLKAYKA
jgi:alkanesulfonate monooxygenase SsuD/methylene tetrahydromethanopterin reductase-like flavin-dependent oxidoreductase (luciferase family)